MDRLMTPWLGRGGLLERRGSVVAGGSCEGITDRSMLRGITAVCS